MSAGKASSNSSSGNVLGDQHRRAQHVLRTELARELHGGKHAPDIRARPDSEYLDVEDLQSRRIEAPLDVTQQGRVPHYVDVGWQNRLQPQTDGIESGRMRRVNLLEG